MARFAKSQTQEPTLVFNKVNDQMDSYSEPP